MAVPDWLPFLPLLLFLLVLPLLAVIAFAIVLVRVRSLSFRVRELENDVKQLLEERRIGRPRDGSTAIRE
jgi:hypothetical protein